MSGRRGLLARAYKRKLQCLLVATAVLILCCPSGTSSASYGQTSPDFSFYAVYDRLADTDGLNARIDHAAMSADGQTLVFSGTDNATGNPVLYTIDADGSNLEGVPLASGISGIWGVTVDRDGSRAFFRDNYGLHLYKVEGGVATRIFDVADHRDIDHVGEIQTMADGEYLYFLAAGGASRGDVWRISHGGGTPTRVIEDTDVDRDGGDGGYVHTFAISADGGTIAFVLQGYWDGIWYSKPELFVLSGGGYLQLTNDTTAVGKEHLDISGDGSTIVFSAGGPQWKWYSIDSDGSDKTALEDHVLGGGSLDLTYDGARVFYYDGAANGGRLVNTDGSGAMDLFPTAGVHPIVLAAPWDTYVSEDGSRVGFRFAYADRKESLYVGYLNAPDAVPDAPAVNSIAFDPLAMPTGDPDARIILTSQISDPQGLADIESTSTECLLDGRLNYRADCPVNFYFAVNDDGSWPDGTADDGVFSSEGKPGAKIDELDEMTVRVGVRDTAKNVVVADTVLSIGGTVPTAAPTASPAATPATTPQPSPAGFAGLIFESRKGTSGSSAQVPLTLKGVQERVGNMDISLSYDSSVLEATGVIKGGLTAGSLFEHNILDGTIRISLADNQGFAGDGSVAYVKFNVIGAEGSSSPLRIVEVAANRASDSARMDLDTQDGVFEVVGIAEIMGDCNGDGKITVVDALCALQMAVGKRAEDLVMDVTGDNKVSSIDARRILRVALGLEEF